MPYKHTQFALVPFMFFVAVSAATGWLSNGFDGAVWVYPFVVLIAAVVAVSARLTVAIDQRNVTASFGFGWPKRVIDLSGVTEVRTVRNKWWYGFGIRKMQRGWMYNVWGLDAVELVFADGKTFRIGTDQPDVLAAAILLQRSVL
jgi:hypothetical protein